MFIEPDVIQLSISAVAFSLSLISIVVEYYEEPHHKRDSVSYLVEIMFMLIMSILPFINFMWILGMLWYFFRKLTGAKS